MSEDRPIRRQPPPTPRWVMALGVVALLLIVLVFTAHMTGMAPTTHGM